MEKWVSVLCHQQTHGTLTDPGVGELGDGEEDNASEYDVALRTLDVHFNRQLNVPCGRHVFREMSQGNYESIDQFIARLHRQSGHCDLVIQLCRISKNKLSKNVRTHACTGRCLNKVTISICKGYKKSVEPWKLLIYKQKPWMTELRSTVSRAHSPKGMPVTAEDPYSHQNCEPVAIKKDIMPEIQCAQQDQKRVTYARW